MLLCVLFVCKFLTVCELLKYKEKGHILKLHFIRYYQGTGEAKLTRYPLDLSSLDSNFGFVIGMVFYVRH